MTFSTKTQLIILCSTAIICVVVGRYTAGSAEVKTTQSISQDKTEHKDTDIHKHEVVTSKKTKDGTTTITKVIDTDTISLKQTETKTEEVNTKDVIPPKVGLTNVSALLSNNFNNGLWSPAYGVSVTHEILGPITIGAFGLTSGVVGVSLGITF